MIDHDDALGPAPSASAALGAVILDRLWGWTPVGMVAAAAGWDAPFSAWWLASEDGGVADDVLSPVGELAEDVGSTAVAVRDTVTSPRAQLGVGLAVVGLVALAVVARGRR